MALVAQTMGHVARIYERESELAVSSSAAALALDDITYELSLVGQGLGEGPAAVVPRRPGSAGGGAGGRGLGEVLSSLEEPRADGRRDLVKDVIGHGPRVLTRDVLSLGFEYLDLENEPISLSKVESTPELRSVRVSLQFLPGDDALLPKRLSTRVALEPRSGTIDFERRDLGVRLSRVFYPIDNPPGVVSRIGSRFALILASGRIPTLDRPSLYTFQMEKRFLSASVDDVI